MKWKVLGLTLLLTALAEPALAQTQISGTAKCGKPDTSQPIEVGDQPGHMLVVEKSACTWSVPLEIAGLKSTAYTSADAADVTNANFQTRGYAIVAMDNGDKAYVRFQGMGGVKEGVGIGEGTWSFTRGTGKLKGLKGKGTYKVTGAADGSGESQVQGDYSLPEPGAAAKKK